MSSLLQAQSRINNQPLGATDAEIRELLEGNICRCTGYQNIVAAVKAGRDGMSAT